MGFVQRTVIGLSFASLNQVGSCPSKSYHSGNGLGVWTKKGLTKLLDNNKVGSVVAGANNSYYTQRFETIPYRAGEASQGRFEFKLVKIAQGTFELFGIVYWKLNKKPGVTKTDNEIIDKANLAVREYWGAPDNGNYTRTHYQLKSRRTTLVIPITFKIMKSLDDGFYFNINVFPESATDPDMSPNYEVVNMNSYSWNMREDSTFSSFERLRPPATIFTHTKRGRGPHEVGHMMGIPHDIGDPNTVMSTKEDLNNWRYYVEHDTSQSKHKKRAKPYTAHFKLFQVWAEKIFVEHMEKKEEFCIKSPYEE